MKKIDLNDYCMQELNTKEMKETNGGFNDLAYALYLAVYCAVETVKKMQYL